jgi:hypothetical protein
LNSIFRLVYVSQASDSICYSDIQKILESAQRHNQNNNLTGLLIYKDHHFIQILEGVETRVMETVSRIIQDRRNHHFRVLVESLSNKRIFERWAMAFHDGDIDKSTRDLIVDLFSTALDQNKKEKEVVLQMLECFRRSSPHFQEV